MAVLAESHIQSIHRMDQLTGRMDQLTERMQTIAQESSDRDRQLGQRIESLATARGEFIRNRPITG